MKQRVMVLPGTVWQIPLIKRLKQKGYEVVVTHPEKESPAYQYADLIVYEDILNKEAVLKAANDLKIVAIMSDECDIATPTLAYVSSRLGLPTQTESIARLYTDKSLMRDFCRLQGLPFPEYRVCESLDDAISFFRALKGKMIIKPIDANSSRGVFTIDSEEVLISRFEDSIHYSHHRKAVICERFISGAEFSVDGIRLPNRHVCLAISEKQQFDYNRNLDKVLYFSYDNPLYDYNYLRDINNRYVEASGLPFGFTHAEYRYENGEFYLLEIGARGGGNLISSHIVPALTGLNTYDYLIDMFVGNSVKEDEIVPELLKNNKIAVLKFFDTTEKGGVVRAIEGLDYLNSHKEVLYYQFNFRPGETIHRPTDGGNRVGFFIACTEGRETMDKLLDDIDRSVVIQYE